jgi:hypothetical protein
MTSLTILLNTSIHISILVNPFSSFNPFQHCHSINAGSTNCSTQNQITINLNQTREEGKIKSDKKKNLIKSAKRILEGRREVEASKRATQKTLILSEKHTKQHKTQSCRSEEDELNAEESDDEMLLRMNKDTVQSCDAILGWMDEVCIP